MDSYQFYHLYHSNIEGFQEIIENLEECDDNLLTALKNLIFNTDLIHRNELREICYEKIIELIKKDVNFQNPLLDEVLNAILYFDYDFPLNLNEVILNIGMLRIIRAAVNRRKKNYEFLESTGVFLVDRILQESSLHGHIVGLLKLLIKIDDKIEKKVLQYIIEKSKFSYELCCLQSICYFFDRSCHLKIIDFNDFALVKKYFKVNTKLSRKQGMFIIKNLIAHDLLDNVENWKIFTIILENLEENPSHLILPTLDLMKNLIINENFEFFWFFLLQSIIKHENNSVKLWGLNYVFNLEGREFQKTQILEILKALNFTLLFEDEKLIENIKKFILNHFEGAFECLIDIEWTSVAFYHILEAVVDHVKTMSSFSSIFLANIHKQSEIIPRKIRNKWIRGGVQILYTKIIERIIKMAGFVQMLPTIVNVFKITDNHSSIDNCLRYVQREDHEFIFKEKYPHNFLKYCLMKLYTERDLNEMRMALNKIQRPQRLLMEVICELNDKVDGYEDDPDILIHEMIEEIFKNTENSVENLEILAIGLNSLKTEMEYGNLDHLVEIWRLIGEKSKFSCAYWKVLTLILKHHKKFDPSIIENEIFPNCDKDLPIYLLVECQIYFLKLNRENSIEKFTKVIENVENLIEISKDESELKILIEILENLSLILPEDESLEDLTADLMKGIIRLIKEVNELSVEFWERILSISSNFKGVNIQEKLNLVISSFLETSHDFEQFELLRAALNLSSSNFVLMPVIKDCMIDKMFASDVMAKEIQLEFTLGSKLDKFLLSKLHFRLDIAKFLSKHHSDDFKSLMEQKLEDLKNFSKKKPRYYSNSLFHRQKLHIIQPLAFLSEISESSINSLLFELTQVTNQLNITYMLEITLAKFCPDFLKRIDVNSYKASHLKSIFCIAVMQIRHLKTFEDAEKFLIQIFDLIFPFVMGKNFGVRTYAMVSLILSVDYVKTMSGFKFTQNITKFTEIIDLMMKSVQDKNAQIYFKALSEDFRFSKDFEELFSVESFYGRIPKVTNMPYEEIVDFDGDVIDYKAADMYVKSIEEQVFNDELEIPLNDVNKAENSVNLQQKYLPYKFKIPGDQLLRTLPSAFAFYDEIEMTLKSKSDLIVVASLIEHSNNLGGLARSCEIFGVSNYVIHSLRATENLDFKSLSKTAEKWLKITEIKSFQVMEYLIGMKSAGYSIVGAEQTGNSKSLFTAKIPKKSVLLLGNEREGIPVDLLSILDLTLEIPQFGVVRSLNVHVTASILLWEYAKQHLIKF